jgi:ribosomal-protein-alanine N-acetyltransferase
MVKYSRETMPKPKGVFETKRLILQSLDHQHEAGMWEMLSDPEFVRYVPFELATDRAAAKALFEEQINGKERFKFHLSIEWKNPKSGEDPMVGFAMCRPSEDGNWVEFGYCIVRRFWGMGIASEASEALIHQVAKSMGAPIEDLVARIDPDNIASLKVVEKFGFKVTEKIIEDEKPLLVLHWAG